MENIRTFKSTHLAVLKQEGFIIQKWTNKQIERYERIPRKSEGGRAPRSDPEFRYGSEYERVIKPPFPKATFSMFRKLITFCIKGDIIGLNECLEVEGNYIIVESLLMSCAKDNITGYNAYEFSCIQGNLEIVRRLLKIEKAREVFGRAIEFSIMTDNLQLVRLFKSQCLPIVHKTQFYFSKELYFALKYDRKTILNFLTTDKKFDVNAIDYAKRFSAIQYASQNGDLDIVKWLIENKADPNKNINSDKNQTPLRLAAKGGHCEIVELLINHGANVITKDKYYQTLGILEKINTKEEGFKCDAKDAEVITKILQNEMNKRADCEDETDNDDVPENEYIREDDNEDDDDDDDDDDGDYDEDIEQTANVTKNSIDSCRDASKGNSSTVNLEQPKIISIGYKRKQYDLTNLNESDDPTIKSRKTVVESLEDYSSIVQPHIDSIMNTDCSFEKKMVCLCAINAMISRKPQVCELIAKEEILNEIAAIVETLVKKIEKEHATDLTIIAKILTKIEATNEGKKLINGMKMSFGASDLLRAEMRKVVKISEPGDFTFDSDRLKSEIEDVE